MVRIAFAVIQLAGIIAFVAPEVARAAESQSGTGKSAVSLFDVESWQIQPPGHVAPLQFGALLTAEANAGARDAIDRSEGFDVTDARLKMGGQLEGGFGYVVQGDLVRTPTLLDLVIDWKSKPVGFRVAAGFFRTPFSGELLIGAPNLDFIDRSQVARALAPARQIGIQLDQQIFGEALVIKAGIFNGNGRSTNDDDRFLYMLRFDGTSYCDDASEREKAWRFDYGVNGAYSEEDGTAIGIARFSPLMGERWLAGADVRATHGHVFFSSEFLHATIDPDGRSKKRIWGYQASTGFDVSELVQLLVRYDSLHAGASSQDRDLAIASAVLNFSKIISLQVELRVPTRGEDPDPGGIANLSVTF